MGNISLGLNLEFAFLERGSFDWALDQAADMGYEYVEPMVHWGRELLSAARKFHSVSMLEDPLEMKEAVESRGLKISALTSHAPLARPEISVEYLRQAVRYAADCGAPRIITDDGPAPDWTTPEEVVTLMRYSLQQAAVFAERRSIEIAIENCGAHTATPERLDEVFGLVQATDLTINLDTGNAYLSENDPLDWVRLAAPQMKHMHAKDIPEDEGRRLRGHARGMLGCACGAGLIEWEPIIEILQAAPNDIVMSVECRSLADARASIEHLRSRI